MAERRTVCTEPAGEGGADLGGQLAVDAAACRAGRVLSVMGLVSLVEDDAGGVVQCATRRLLKTLATDQRHVVAAGDRVLFRPVENSNPKEGLIERVEPRHGCICRAVRGRQQILVANVDRLAIIASAAEPRLKPNLIDRLLVTAEKGGVRPLICINKIDLVDPADFEPLVGVYSQMGYEVLLVSAMTGFGVDRFRRRLAGAASVVAGQSGVGKSSLLNAIDPELRLRVQPVSEETEKGKHTTTTARLLPLTSGGYVIDTPGMRQFQLWDVRPRRWWAFTATCGPTSASAGIPTAPTPTKTTAPSRTPWPTAGSTSGGTRAIAICGRGILSNKRWSKLQARVYSMVEPTVPFQIHYIAYPMRSQRGSTLIPRCYITIGQEIIWDFPHDFPSACVDPYSACVECLPIASILREWTDASRNGLLELRRPRTVGVCPKYSWPSIVAWARSDCSRWTKNKQREGESDHRHATK